MLTTSLNSELLAAFTPGAAPTLRPCFIWRCHTYQHCDFPSDSSTLYISTVQSGSPLLAALPPHFRLQTYYPPSSHFVFSPSTPSLPLHAADCLSTPPASSSPSDSLRVLQWNAGSLPARSTKLLLFRLAHPVDLICIQKSNLNSSSSFRIPGFSALRSDHAHSRSDTFSPDVTHASGGIVFSSGRAYPSRNLLPPLFLRLIPTLIM